MGTARVYKQGAPTELEDEGMEIGCRWDNASHQHAAPTELDARDVLRIYKQAAATQLGRRSHRACYKQGAPTEFEDEGMEIGCRWDNVSHQHAAPTELDARDVMRIYKQAAATQLGWRSHRACYKQGAPTEFDNRDTARVYQQAAPTEFDNGVAVPG